MYAIYKGHTEVTKLLIAHKANLDLQDNVSIYEIFVCMCIFVWECIHARGGGGEGYRWRGRRRSW